jgi:phosphatidate cytidylyltransferase
MKPLTFWTGMAIAAIILANFHFASSLFLRRDPLSTAWAKFNARSKDWWLVLLAIAFCYAVGPGTLIFAFALASFMALREVLSATPVKPSDANPLFVAFFIAAPGQYLLLAFRAYGLFSIFIPVYVFFALTAMAVFASDKADFLARNARIQWALMVTVYGSSFAPALLTLHMPDRAPDGMMFFFFLFVGQMSEAAQFIASRLMGKTLITERLKTITREGVGASVVFSFAIGAAISAATPFAWWQAGLAAMAISVAGLCGILAMAAAKESLGIKLWRPASEAGGGMAERMDAICFSAPIFFHIAKSFYPG